MFFPWITLVLGLCLCLLPALLGETIYRKTPVSKRERVWYRISLVIGILITSVSGYGVATQDKHQCEKIGGMYKTVSKEDVLLPIDGSVMPSIIEKKACVKNEMRK